MKLSDIAKNRLFNQQLSVHQFTSVQDLVEWMGAMQAQDFEMARWAVGIRLASAKIHQIESAINKGEIFRAHLLRPTWHFVSANDIDWMLDLTSPQIRQAMKSRNLQLGLTESVISKSNEILSKVLADGRHSTREDLIRALKDNNIQTDENRASHLFLCAELDKIICSGSILKNKQTYALYEMSIKLREKLPKEEALNRLAMKYFQSHGPATIQDFTWWSGLSVKDARIGLENIQPQLIHETINSELYWAAEASSEIKKSKKMVQLLPAYDELIISYKNREAVISHDSSAKAISSNGLFRPTVIVDGQVTGLWNRRLIKNHIVVEISLFRPHTNAELNLLQKSCKSYGDYMGRKVEFSYFEMKIN